MGRRIFSDRGGRNETPRNLSGCGAWGVGVCGALLFVDEIDVHLSLESLLQRDVGLRGRNARDVEISAVVVLR